MTRNNAFLQLLREAEAKNWCMTMYCTTCGNREFRRALRRIGGDLGGPLANALTDLDIDELLTFRKWEFALAIALHDLPLQAMSLLESWLSEADQNGQMPLWDVVNVNLRFFDFVLYKFIRHLPEGHPVRAKWVTKGLAIAMTTRDFSIVESLILILRDRSLAHDQLLDIAKALAAGSSQMRIVLRNACGIEIDAAR